MRNSLCVINSSFAELLAAGNGHSEGLQSPSPFDFRNSWSWHYESILLARGHFKNGQIPPCPFGDLDRLMANLLSIEQCA